jgi:hypothetical protein
MFLYKKLLTPLYKNIKAADLAAFMFYEIVVTG